MPWAGLVKEVALETGSEEVLDEVSGLLFAAAEEAEVAIDRFPVALDEEPEDGGAIRNQASAQGYKLTPVRGREGPVGGAASLSGLLPSVVWAHIGTGQSPGNG